MATSGSTDFTLTRNDILTEAFQLIGIGMEGEDISAFMLETAARSLNMMIKTWETKGARIWAKSEKTIALAASKSSYILTPRPLEVMNVRVVYSGQETPLTALSRQEYYDLPNKTSSGVPTTYHYDAQRTTGTLYLWPVPSDASRTLKYSYRRTLEDVDGAADEMDFPQEWLEALATNLAVRLRPKYGRPFDPDLAARARVLESELMAWGQENESIFLGVERI